MSTFNDIDVECENCGETFRGTVWVAIHAGQDPELKELLLGGELNLVSCPHCMHVAFHERFLIYQEPAAELVAYVYPVAQREQEADLQKLMLSGFEEAQATLPDTERLHYDPVLLFGLEDLIELLQREVSIGAQSQVAQAICKEHNLPMALLRPSQARALQSPRVIPYKGHNPKPTYDEVMAGIDALLHLDPVLDEYQKLKQNLKNDPSWSLS